MGDQNFMMNSGSYFIFLVAVVENMLLMMFINWVMTWPGFATDAKYREWGMWAYKKNYFMSMI